MRDTPLFCPFDVPDTFATVLHAVEVHTDFVRLVYAADNANELRPVASIVMTKPAFQKAVREYFEVEGLRAN